MAKEVFLHKEITNQDVYKELIKQGKVQKEILEHAKYTNGQVAKNLKAIEDIKNKSIGIWITRHPFRFAVGLLVVIAILISDIRHPIFDLLAKLFI